MLLPLVEAQEVFDAPISAETQVVRNAFLTRLAPWRLCAPPSQHRLQEVCGTSVSA